MIFFFNDTATTEIYTLSLHDALPISGPLCHRDRLLVRDIPIRPLVTGCRSLPRLVEDGTFHGLLKPSCRRIGAGDEEKGDGDRKSTRLNSSHANISYAVFCLKKKINQ